MRFVLIDRFVELDIAAGRATAVMTFPADEEIFRDHFPGFPVVPGVLLTEAMGQTGGWLIASRIEFARWPMLNMIQHAKFRRFARPGEEILIRTQVEQIGDEDWAANASSTIGATRIAEARLAYHGFSLDLSPDGRASLEQWARNTFEKLAPRPPRPE